MFKTLRILKFYIMALCPAKIAATLSPVIAHKRYGAGGHKTIVRKSNQQFWGLKNLDSEQIFCWGVLFYVLNSLSWKNTGFSLSRLLVPWSNLDIGYFFLQICLNLLNFKNFFMHKIIFDWYTWNFSWVPGFKGSDSNLK